jgi:8-oxo-dGTP pyrophosphatase MutT (NUDIX family)
MTEEFTSEAIRSLRERRGWTQAELAHELGTDPVTVSRWERGVSRPRRSANIRLAEIARRSARRSATFPVGVAMVVVNRRSEVLLLEDPDTGLLEVPSGAVEDGETIIDAVRRELREELGPHASLRPVGTVHAYTITYEPGVALVSVVYLVAYDGGGIFPSDDALGTTPRWLDRSELMRRSELVRVPNEPRILDRALTQWARSTGQVAKVSAEDKRRMRRLAVDLSAIDNAESIDIDGYIALREWLNERRASRGLPPVDHVEDEVPELRMFERAKALGMVRPRRRGR